MLAPGVCVRIGGSPAAIAGRRCVARADCVIAASGLVARQGFEHHVDRVVPGADELFEAVDQRPEFAAAVRRPDVHLKVVAADATDPHGVVHGRR
jgi:hypothetical protein